MNSKSIDGQYEMNTEDRQELVDLVTDQVVRRIAMGNKINALADKAIARMFGYPVPGTAGIEMKGRVGAPPAESGVQRKLILRSKLSPGDILMLTAAVRDLHLTYPGQFLTDVRTSCPALWENNPYVTPLFSEDPGVETVDCEYPLIHGSNQIPYHFIHGYRMHLNDKLGIQIRPHAFKGDIHISEQEKHWMSQVQEIREEDTRFWIIVSGGKTDFTNKIWDPARFQEVVNHFKSRITFVQIGEARHIHPPLKDVIDLVGKTDLRQFVRLMYHADGVVCGVSLPMHLAAAVETRSGRPKNRPCVVIAGGREPANWEAYPHHAFLHRHSTLPCCDAGGCWKSRIEPLGDGEKHDESLCTLPVTLESGRKLPRCLDLITAQDVIRAIELYLEFPAPQPDAPATVNVASVSRSEALVTLSESNCHPEPKAKDLSHGRTDALPEEHRSAITEKAVIV